jgi:predicted CoA-binding protein
MSDAQRKHILQTARTIASVGVSSNPAKPSYGVVAYLKSQGYRIIPVNPGGGEILGEQAYVDLISIPEAIDVVQLFRPAEEVMPFVQQAIQIGAKVVWLQEGIVNEEAAQTARAAGLEVVMDQCMRSSHRRLIGERFSL